MPCLVIADADAIQDYVFACHELKLLRGGSGIQTGLMAELKRLAKHLNPARKHSVLRANGGTIIAEFPNKAAGEKFRREASRLFRERTGSAATVTTAHVPDTAPFDKCIEDLYSRLAMKKRWRLASEPVGKTPYSASCQACGMFAARESLADEDSRVPRVLCLACCLRLTNSRGIRYRLNPRRHLTTLEGIAERAKPANFLAIVYIDIDRLGEFMNGKKYSKTAYRAWSARIDFSVRRSIETARRVIDAPSEALLIGGDDAMVAIPAGCLYEFLKAFRARYRGNHYGTELPTFSVGAAIANSHFPITEFRRIASDLLRSAKTLREFDSVDYEIVTSSMTGKVIEDRSRADGRFRTAKPYHLEEWFRFCRSALDVKREVPASQVKALYRIANEGPLQAELEYDYLLTRVSVQARAYLKQIIAPGETVLDTRFWLMKPNGAVCTRAADLVEIQDFVNVA